MAPSVVAEEFEDANKGAGDDSSLPGSIPPVRRERSCRRSSQLASIYAGMTGTTAASSATAAETEELGRARERDGGAGERRKGMRCEWGNAWGGPPWPRRHE